MRQVICRDVVKLAKTLFGVVGISDEGVGVMTATRKNPKCHCCATHCLEQEALLCRLFELVKEAYAIADVAQQVLVAIAVHREKQGVWLD